MRSLISCVVAATAFAAATPAICEEYLNLNDAFGRFGYKTTKTTTKSTCKIVSDIDQTLYVKSIPKLQEMGLLNRDIKQTQINREPKTLSMVFALQMIPVLIPDAFRDETTANRCSFSQTVTAPDLYGNDQTQTIFTFDFTRELNKKINWSKFDAGNLPKVAPNFNLDRRFLAISREETE